MPLVMTSPPETGEAPLEQATGHPFTEFIDTLGRLFVSHTIYPGSHPRCQELATMALDKLAGILEQDAEVFVGVTDDGYEWGDQVVEKGSTGQSERLHHNLDALAIAGLRFTSDATVSDVNQLLSGVQEAVQMSLRGKWNFESWAENLSPATMAVQADYGTPTSTAPALDTSIRRHLVQEVMRPLRDQDVSESVRTKIRRFAEQIIENTARLAKTTPEGAKLKKKKKGESDGKLASDDIITMAAVTLQRVIQSRLEDGEEDLCMDSLFDDFGQVLNRSFGALETDGIVSQLRDTTENVLMEKFRYRGNLVQRKKKKTEPLVGSLDGFHQELDEFVGSFQIPKDQDWSSDQEHLSMLMMMLPGAEESVVPQIERRICQMLSRKPSERDLQMVCCAVLESYLFLTPGTIDTIFPVLGEQMQSLGVRAFSEFLLELSEKGGRSTTTHLWPHLAWEFLHRVPADQAEVRVALMDRLHEVSPDVLAAEMPRFLALVGKYDTQDIHSPPPIPRLYPFYEALLATSGLAGVRTAIYTAFQNSPPLSPAASALFAMEPTQQGAIHFLREVLAEFSCGRRSHELLIKAAGILEWRLKKLARNRRGDPIGRKLIHALGKLPCPDSVRMLKTVRDAKRGWCRHEWPKVCRIAATASLEEIQLEKNTEPSERLDAK